MEAELPAGACDVVDCGLSLGPTRASSLVVCEAHAVKRAIIASAIAKAGLDLPFIHTPD